MTLQTVTLVLVITRLGSTGSLISEMTPLCQTQCNYYGVKCRKKLCIWHLNGHNQINQIDCDRVVCVCVCVCVCSGEYCVLTHVSVVDVPLSAPPPPCLHQSAVPQPTFSMPVTVPVSNHNVALQFTNNPGGTLVTTASFTTSPLTDPRLLSPQQPALQRNSVSPGLPQRPASAGETRCSCSR